MIGTNREGKKRATAGNKLPMLTKLQVAGSNQLGAAGKQGKQKGTLIKLSTVSVAHLKKAAKRWW